MLRAIAEYPIRPDLVLGCSVGALNGAYFAADPTPAGASELERAWTGSETRHVFSESVFARLATLVRYGTHLHSHDVLRLLLEGKFGGVRIEDFPVRFECVAASIERAAAHWFDRGSVVDAVLASCAVPGLLPPVEIGGEHFMDGGLVYSVPVGPAIARGATRVFVLQVGRLERPLTPPRRPWEVALVAFEIARRYRFNEDIAGLPATTEIYVLPSGADVAALNLRYRRRPDNERRIDAAYQASKNYLAGMRAGN
jgi:NTE family protein